MNEPAQTRSFQVVLAFPDLTRKRAYPLPVPLAVEAVSEAEAIRTALARAKRFFNAVPRLVTVRTVRAV